MTLSFLRDILEPFPASRAGGDKAEIRSRYTLYNLKNHKHKSQTKFTFEKKRVSAAAVRGAPPAAKRLPVSFLLLLVVSRNTLNYGYV